MDREVRLSSIRDETFRSVAPTVIITPRASRSSVSLPLCFFSSRRARKLSLDFLCSSALSSEEGPYFLFLQAIKGFSKPMKIVMTLLRQSSLRPSAFTYAPIQTQLSALFFLPLCRRRDSSRGVMCARGCMYVHRYILLVCSGFSFSVSVSWCLSLCSSSRLVSFSTDTSTKSSPSLSLSVLSGGSLRGP